MSRPAAPLLVLSVALVAGLAFAQTVPRGPVIPVHPSAGGAPAPTPLPDPSGVYAGTSTLQVTGVSGSFTQNWRIDLRTRNCPDCIPGQYYVHGTNYNALSYRSGAVEKGGVYGSVNSNGRAFDLQIYAVNCGFVNPSRATGGAPYAGSMWGGSFGESVGTPLLVRDSSMAGRMSGRDCFGRIVTADVALTKQATSLPAACVSIAGTYTGSFANTCGGSGSASLTLTQAGCYVGGSIASLGIGLEGTVTGSNSIAINLNDPCSTGIYSGTASITGSTIVGSYSGVSAGGVGCCPPGPVSGSFTLTRN